LPKQEAQLLQSAESRDVTPLSFAPSIPMFPLKFCGEVKLEETRVTGLSFSEDTMMIAWVVLTQCQRVTDRRTDRQTDRQMDTRTD